MLDILAVCELSGLEPQTLRNWISGGLVTPAGKGGAGRGCGHRFSVTQAVGLVVAAAYRRTWRGCGPEGISLLVGAFGAVTGDWLEAKFREGRTHLATVHQGRPLLQGQAYDWPDVRAAYQAVTSRAEVCGREEAPAPRTVRQKVSK